jgi:hypothetical protein
VRIFSALLMPLAVCFQNSRRRLHAGGIFFIIENPGSEKLA